MTQQLYITAHFKIYIYFYIHLNQDQCHKTAHTRPKIFKYSLSQQLLLPTVSQEYRKLPVQAPQHNTIRVMQCVTEMQTLMGREHTPSVTDVLTMCLKMLRKSAFSPLLYHKVSSKLWPSGKQTPRSAWGQYLFTVLVIAMHLYMCTIKIIQLQQIKSTLLIFRRSPMH